MNDVIQKLSSYNLFNYLLPGTIFTFFVERMTNHNLMHDNLVVAVFVFYFFGLVISRLGSIFIEPILKIMAKHASYEDYVNASDKDEMLQTLSEQNNVFRTIIAMLVCVLCILFYDYIILKYPGIVGIFPYLILCSLILIFALAYRKQTQYIVRRVKSRLDRPIVNDQTVE